MVLIDHLLLPVIDFSSYVYLKSNVLITLLRDSIEKGDFYLNKQCVHVLKRLRMVYYDIIINFYIF